MKRLSSKFVLMLVIASILLLGISSASAMEPKNCVTVETKNFYAREVHNDFIVREIQVCLTTSTKWIVYELPPLTVPLVLESTDGALLSVEVAPIDNPDQLIIDEVDESVEIVLPQSNSPVRYQMKVAVATSSEGVIEGLIDGEVVGRILLFDFHDDDSNSLIVALGGLSTEWWFQATSRPAYSLVRFGLITVPTDAGEFELSADGWMRISRSEPLVILGDGWLEGGYFAIKTVFPK